MDKKKTLKILHHLEKAIDEYAGKELTAEEQTRKSDLLMLHFLVRNQNWKEMEFFINRCIYRLNTGGDLSRETVWFVIELLQDAAQIARLNPKARNNPIASALCLSGRANVTHKHMDIAEKVCEESFKHRHKKDPIGHAIGALNLDVKNDYALSIVKKNKSFAMAMLASTTNDPRKRDYFRNQIPPEERAKFLLE